MRTCAHAHTHAHMQVVARVEEWADGKEIYEMIDSLGDFGLRTSRRCIYTWHIHAHMHVHIYTYAHTSAMHQSMRTSYVPPHAPIHAHELHTCLLTRSFPHSLTYLPIPTYTYTIPT